MQLARPRLVIWPLLSRQAVLDVAFFGGIPLILSLTMAVAGRYVDAIGYAGGVLYVAALSFVPWLVAGLTTQFAFMMLRPMAPPLWLVAAAGVLLSAPFVAPTSTRSINGSLPLGPAAIACASLHGRARSTA
jgi:hypothetical protein